MKKILLIEDRGERQKLFMDATHIDLEDYSDILENIVEKDAYEKLYDALKNDTFNFDAYNIIITHKSAFDDDNANILSKIKNHCKNNNKPLVYFSGGISANYYNHDEYEFIELNSKIFYSENVKLFLENFRVSDSENLQMLCYGKKWKLNILLIVLEKVNYFLTTNKKAEILYDQLRNKTHIDLLEKTDFNYYNPIQKDVWIEPNEILNIRDNIRKHIQEEMLNA